MLIPLRQLLFLSILIATVYHTDFASKVTDVYWPEIQENYSEMVETTQCYFQGTHRYQASFEKDNDHGTAYVCKEVDRPVDREGHS